MKNAPQASFCIEGLSGPDRSLPTAPAIVVVVVLTLFTGLTLFGMPAESVALTLGAGGLLGIELVRRLIQTFPHHRSR
ncbi:hypothetical protein CCS38_31230 [Streptomyces purpurogeneiscleroticus]|nr:hypothetical protein [Streptomyces purpurogeneiscleroticus]